MLLERIYTDSRNLERRLLPLLLPFSPDEFRTRIRFEISTRRARAFSTDRQVSSPSPSPA